MYRLLNLLMNLYQDIVKGCVLNSLFKFTVKSSDVILLLKLLVKHYY